MTEIFRLVGKIGIENQEANRAIEETTDKAEKGSSSMVQTFKKIGSAVVAAFAVDKVIDFGKQVVQAAAEIQAQNAQFAASFGDLQDEAVKAFERVGSETGILSSRLQVEGTKAFSMFKGAGMEANEALLESERFLQLAADAAAYYDISLEEASARVLGFAKGNFENGDAIGVFTNETQRNSIAMEAYGKKYAELTEAQKQMLALDMIENTYEMSGALGQASREADGYENVMGNLRESWRQFLGVIGDPLLQMVIPIVKGITSGVQALTEWVSNLGSVFGNTNSTMSSIWETYGKPVFDKMVEVGQILYDAWLLVFPTLQDLWNTLMVTLQAAWDTVGKPMFDFFYNIVVEIIDIFIAYFPQVAQVFNDVLTVINDLWLNVLLPVLTAIGSFVMDYLLPTWNYVWEQTKNVLKVAFDFFVSIWEGTLKPLLQGIIDFVSGVFSGNWSQAWEGIKTIVSSIITGILNTITSIFTAIFNFISTTVGNIFNTVSSIFTNIWNTATDIFGKVFEAITKPIEDAKNFVKDMIDKILSFFDFEWSLPKLKMPHITISGSFNLMPPSVPSFGIEWYKEGGILEKPMAFGINPNSGKVMAGGEAGKEAVAPISELMDYVRVAVAESNGGMADILERILALLAELLPNMNRSVILDTGVLVGEITPQVDEELGRIKDRRGR